MSLVTLCVLSICITRRVQRIRQWSALPLAAWLIVIIYVDSFLFVFVTALFKDIGLNNNPEICEGAILLCLICYMTTKIFIYLFLVEKAVSSTQGGGVVAGSHPESNSTSFAGAINPDSPTSSTSSTAVS